ncbi:MULTISPECIES: hypothetical protein [Streptomyces]|nr:hypothetical protein [Streptomyces sp. DSM 41859]
MLSAPRRARAFRGLRRARKSAVRGWSSATAAGKIDGTTADRAVEDW